MKRKLFCIIIIYISFDISGHAQTGSTLLHRHINNTLLDTTVHYSVLLPNQYDSTATYPTLILLHGHNGNHTNWMQQGKIQETYDSLRQSRLIHEMIIVMPDGFNSYYINNYNNSFRYEDFFMHDLIPHIKRSYKTDSVFSIGGLSMGGFGALFYASKYPQIFPNCIALSPSIRNEQMFINLPQTTYHKFFEEIYGETSSDSLRITNHWLSNSPYYIIESQATAFTNSNWYISVGTADYLFNAVSHFDKFLNTNNIEHQTQFKPGKHGWVFWRKNIALGLVEMFGE